ncbi:hypothetical protein F4779DRAFT_595428 [Xylariaceae sp. FL0662B]|nr:hypothetical protein F4779DRAFT_595428 [Xylariaceae sp. FL0662B]
MDSELFSDDLPPPPYKASITGFNNNHPNSLTSHMQQHVASLTDRIREQQQARTAQVTSNDISILEDIVPIIEEFLVDICAQHTTPPSSTLTLVPDVAVPRNAVLSELEEMRRRGEFCRVLRVTTQHSQSKDQKSTSAKGPNFQSSSTEQRWVPGREFSDWGRFGEPSFSIGDTIDSTETLWWRDEAMAHRLAGYLQPEIEDRPYVESEPIVPSVMAEKAPPAKEKKGWFSGIVRSRRTSGAAVAEPDEPMVANVTPQMYSETKQAEMQVFADKVAFRYENEFGLLQSISGWAIVVVVSFKVQLVPR